VLPPPLHELVMDNDATLKTQPIRAWPARPPHRHVYLIPTSAAWLNQIEQFLRHRRA
jgi:hypothetical protein